MVLWSNIVQKKKPPDRKDTKPPDPKKLPARRNAITHTISSSLAAQKKIFERERRTHILRKLPPSTTLNEVIAGVADTLNIVARDQQLGNHALNDIVESVIRDTNDHRRYYITYCTYEFKKKFASLGYTINDTIIPPEFGDVSVCIPHPPFYLDALDFATMLQQYGSLTNTRFVSVNGVRTGAFHFDINLKENARLPEFIDYDGHMIQIVDKGSLKQCSHCDSYGHLRRECRKLAPQYVLSVLRISPKRSYVHS